jgi:hypothetical protein
MPPSTHRVIDGVWVRRIAPGGTNADIVAGSGEGGVCGDGGSALDACLNPQHVAPDTAGNLLPTPRLLRLTLATGRPVR